MKTRLLIIIVLGAIAAITTSLISSQSFDTQYSQENPYGFSARVLYDPHFLPIMCPTQDNCGTHLHLGINSEIPAILQGYKICNGFSCVTQDSMHFSTKDPGIIPVFDGNRWNVGDKVSIKAQVVTQYDETYTHPPPIPYYIDLGESEIDETGVILPADTTCDETTGLEIAKIPEFGEPSRLVFSVKQNTIAHICIKYSSNQDNEGTLNLSDDLHDRHLWLHNGTESNVPVTVTPGFIPLQKGQSTTVDYAVAVPPDAYGVYWLWISQMCERIPVVTDGYQLSPDDIPIVMGRHGCPAILLNAKITGYSNADVQYHAAKTLPGR